MSVQLIVYPQWYDGVPSPISVTPVSTAQMLANPYNFSSIGSGTSLSVGTSTLTQTAIVNNIATLATNTWYGFYDNATGLITGSLGSLLIYNAVAIQKISGLVVGGLYDVRITWSSTPTPQVGRVKIYDGTILQSTITAVPDASNEATVQFTATSIDAIFAFEVITSGTPLVTSISVKGAPVQPPTPIQVLENGQVICDLYEDEDIPLTLSIDNFKNAAEKVQSYSKAFNLPGTKRNNQIFDNMFELTRFVDGRSIQFNPLVRTKAILKQDGVLLFEGFLRMLDITDNEGEVSYNVNLYSEVIALADTLKDRILSDLDFTELEHGYTYPNIRNSWQGILSLTNPLPAGTFAGTAGASTTSVLKYPFVDWNHQYEVNISTGNPELPNLESAFRPFIKLKYIIDMIFNSTEFSYTSSFFNTSDFENLFMDFNWGSGNAPVVFNSTATVFRNLPYTVGTSFATINFDISSPSTLPTEFGYSSGVFTAQTDNQLYNISFDMTFDLPGAATPPEQLTIQWLVDGVPTNLQVSPFVTTTSSYNYIGTFSATLSAGETILCQAKSSGTFLRLIGGSNSVNVTTSSDQTTNETLLETLRGELGQWDFLKGLITMFNLITMPDPDNPNNLIIEPYSDVFIKDLNGINLASRGVQHDWTGKVDASEMKLAPLSDLNKKTTFKFAEDDDDFCFNEYKRQVSGHLYGSKIWDASDLTLLEGEEEISAEPFAATIPAPLMPQYADFIVPKIYASENGEECEGFDNAPRIMYSNGVHDLTSCTYRVPAQNGGLTVGAENEYLRFSHLTDVPTILGDTFDYNFGACQLLPGLGAPVAANLFNTYWLPYYAELYNPNTRTMTLKVDLGAGDISIFQFNDQVMIKNRVYRVNQINYKPKDLSTVEFILIG